MLLFPTNRNLSLPVLTNGIKTRTGSLILDQTVQHGLILLICQIIDYIIPMKRIVLAVYPIAFFQFAKFPFPFLWEYQTHPFG